MLLDSGAEVDGRTFCGIKPLTSASGVLTIDTSLGDRFRHVLTENTSVKPDPTTLQVGQSFTVWLKQHASAAKTVSFSSFFHFVGGVVPSMNASVRAYSKFWADVEEYSSAVVTMSTGTPGQIGWTGHGLDVDDTFCMLTTGALLAGATAGQVYFVQSVVDSDHITFAATKGGAAQALSGTQNGVHTGYFAILSASMANIPS